MANWHKGLSKLQYRLDTIDAEGVDQRMPFPDYPPTLTSEEIRRRLLRFGWHPWPVSSGNAFARDFVARLTPICEQRIFKSPDGFLNKMAPLFGPVGVLNEVLGDYRVHGANVWAQSERLQIARLFRERSVLMPFCTQNLSPRQPASASL
jgi:hypothetical protein